MDNEAKIIPLQQFYLAILVAAMNAEKLDAVQQDIAPDAGRLWLVPKGTSVPYAQIAYRFELDAVTIAIVTRDERKQDWSMKYAEGLDGIMPEIQKLMRAGRLSAPRRAA